MAKTLYEQARERTLKEAEALLETQEITNKLYDILEFIRKNSRDETIKRKASEGKKLIR